MFLSDLIIKGSSLILEMAGIIIIVSAAVYSTSSAIINLMHKRRGVSIYRPYRRQLSRGILLGLEFLVGAISSDRSRSSLHLIK